MQMVMDNPIGWAHFQLRGGLRGVILTGVAYGVAILGLIMLMVGMERTQAGVNQMLQGWTMGLLGLQIAVLLLFGASRVGAAIRQDIDGRMIESHRLMPVPGSLAVGGYLLGASSQAMGLWTANLLIGTATAASVGYSLNWWFMANGILLLFAVFIWVMVSFVAFSFKYPFSWLMVLVVLFFVSEGELAGLIPGATLLVSPLIGESIFEMRTDLPWYYTASLLGQLTMGALFFAGAARRYRRDGVPGLGASLGVMLLAVWVGMSIIGILDWESFRPGVIGWWYGPEPATQFIFTLLGTMLVALAPVSGAAWEWTDWHRRRRLDDPGLKRRPLAPVLMVLAAAGLASLVVLVDPFPSRVGLATGAVATGAVVLSFLTAMSFVVGWCYRSGWRPMLVGGLWIVVTWLAPLMIDTFRHAMVGDPRARVLGIAGSCSPIGTIIGLTDAGPAFTWFGVGVQASLAVVAAGIYFARRGGND